MCQHCKIHITTCQLSWETQCKFFIVTVLNLLWLCGILVTMQFVDFANHSIPLLPCVVFSIAFASSEFNLRFDWKKTSFLLEQDWPIFPSWNTHFCLHCTAQQCGSYILDPLFGVEHINMFAQQFTKWICTPAHSYTLPQTCQNKKKHLSPFLLNIG